ncbi:ribosome assembly cofactor RimP [Niabella ginsengisoli]|uniref:Ribosome maturation factor RimP n=1 Tax=Niabella ginsengisoli TaxID=522298 RepID=A0ABS9SP73_9BACT|nr:ribosome assembly cofactor RimP [Niabella ginsengisoli]MCH5600172.1 ribosome assembly cofactor RimP [Niabella ginsengisoli]
MEAVIQKVEKEILEILAENPDHFLVEIKIKPTNNIRVFIDGDKGVGIGDLVKYNRNLHKVLEEAGFFPEGDFSLEVSSPGLGEPLKMRRQYQKNIDRFVEIIKEDGSKIEGKLLQVNDSEIIVEETKGKGKKAETITHTVSFQDIKSTQIQIKF